MRVCSAWCRMYVVLVCMCVLQIALVFPFETDEIDRLCRRCRRKIAHENLLQMQIRENISFFEHFVLCLSLNALMCFQLTNNMYLLSHTIKSYWKSDRRWELKVDTHIGAVASQIDKYDIEIHQSHEYQIMVRNWSNYPVQKTSIWTLMMMVCLSIEKDTHFNRREQGEKLFQDERNFAIRKWLNSCIGKMDLNWPSFTVHPRIRAYPILAQ